MSGLVDANREPAGGRQDVGDDAVVRLNVGGTMHQVRRSTLMSNPSSLLGRIFSPNSGFDDWHAFPGLPRVDCALDVAQASLNLQRRHVEEFVTSFLNMQPGSVLHGAVEGAESKVDLILGCTQLVAKTGEEGIYGDPVFKKEILSGFTRDLPLALLMGSYEDALLEGLRARGFAASFENIFGSEESSVEEDIAYSDKTWPVFCYYHDAAGGSTQVRGACSSVDWMLLLAGRHKNCVMRDGGRRNSIKVYDLRILTVSWADKLDTLKSSPGSGSNKRKAPG